MFLAPIIRIGHDIMSLPLFRVFTLGGPNGDGSHPYVNEGGAFLGRGVPLLEKDGIGRWRARPRSTLEKLFRVGYGVPVDLGWRITQLGYVAQALNKKETSVSRTSRWCGWNCRRCRMTIMRERWQRPMGF